MKRLEVELDGFGSLVRGFGSRALVEQVTGSAPVFSTIRRGWTCQERTARNVVALAESMGYDIVIIGPRATAALAFDRPAADGERTDPGSGLW